MSIFITTISVAITAATVAFIIREMESAKPSALTSDLRSSLLERKTRLVENLRELELDRRTEKLSEEDHEKLKTQIHRELAATLKELDRYV